MRFAISFSGKRPLGHVLKAKAIGEETVLVQSREFSSTEDGQHFIQRLEGYPQQVLSMIQEQCGEHVAPSTVHSMVVVVDRDLNATACINEGFGATSMRSSGPLAAGQSVYKNDIADFEKVSLEISVPDDAGVMFLFSLGWRKGYYYDFIPLNPHAPEDRSYDCEVLLAELFTYVFFQERFSITEDEWRSLFAARLFPFAGLKNETIDAILAHLRSGWDLSNLSDAISNEVSEHLPKFTQSWREHHIIGKQMLLLDRAIERFHAEDFVSATCILMPQIEGMLRTNHSIVGTGKAKQDKLVDSAVSRKIHRRQSLLLPERFKKYLNAVYFASFPQELLPGDTSAPMSRHTVSHGIVADGKFDRLTAAICLLTVHQLFYFFDRLQSDHEGAAE